MVELLTERQLPSEVLNPELTVKSPFIVATPPTIRELEHKEPFTSVFVFRSIRVSLVSIILVSATDNEVVVEFAWIRVFPPNDIPTPTLLP